MGVLTQMMSFWKYGTDMFFSDSLENINEMTVNGGTYVVLHDCISYPLPSS